MKCSRSFLYVVKKDVMNAVIAKHCRRSCIKK